MEEDADPTDTPTDWIVTVVDVAFMAAHAALDDARSKIIQQLKEMQEEGEDVEDV